MKTETKDLTTKVASMALKTTGDVPATTAKSTLATIFEKSAGEFKKALAGTEQDANRFARICLSLIRSNEKLLDAAKRDPYGVLSACMEMAALGLDPAIPNEASLVPFAGQVKMITGYKGVLKNALNAASEMGRPFKSFVVDVVYDSDTFIFSRVPFELIHKRDPFKQKGALIGFYGYARDINGMEWAEIMSLEEVLAHQKQFCKSLNRNDSAFSNGKNIEIYGIKTVLMRFIRRQLPMSAKLAASIVSMESEDNFTQPLKPTDILGLAFEQNENINDSKPMELSDAEKQEILEAEKINN